MASTYMYLKCDNLDGELQTYLTRHMTENMHVQHPEDAYTRVILLREGFISSEDKTTIHRTIHMNMLLFLAFLKLVAPYVERK